MYRWLLVAWLFSGAANAAGIPLTEREVEVPDFGKIAVGASTEKLASVLRQPVPTPFSPSACFIFSPQGMAADTGLSFVIEDKHVTRINLDYYGAEPEPLSIRTVAGIGLGTAEDDVMKAYAGRARVEPDSGDPTWHYIYVDGPGGETGLRFDTDGSKVKSMHAGEYPALNYKQGCY